MARKELTKRQLIAAYKELDDVAGIDPPIEYEDMGVDEFAKELHDTVVELVEPGDEFTEKTQDVFDTLKEKFSEEEDEPEEEPEEEEEEEKPKKVAKGKAKKSEPEPEEEEEEEDEKPKKAKKEKKEKEEKPKKERKSNLKRGGERTELGHLIDSQAGQIDLALIANKGKEVSAEKLAKAADTNKGRVKAHIKHLIEKKKCDIKIKDDGYLYNG